MGNTGFLLRNSSAGQPVISARVVLEQIERAGVTHVVGLPDNGSRALFGLLWAGGRVEVVQVGREGETFAIASGLYLGGARPVVLIQKPACSKPATPCAAPRPTWVPPWGC